MARVWVSFHLSIPPTNEIVGSKTTFDLLLKEAVARKSIARDRHVRFGRRCVPGTNSDSELRGKGVLADAGGGRGETGRKWKETVQNKTPKAATGSLDTCIASFVERTLC